ncbi:alpha/beta fold hydrolase [Thomasclavelia cocleata]|jgi:pimeloyl-ACP methyl ester carboxylesterase|uniref:AB hydrolase superfamily protein YdjP n=1 Tax=Thomasclavelia cocleata TaxID=69824 RepID=A0A829Z7W2_9FIRM|nr:alpha/beta hydrolase [Thomasclavelia cocleata]MCI9130538.1 alpha/beta hydrolase [Thomasclavelia cocleata]MCI9629485.1 alpha/beta hydrolase [Thomasclavelia cocleata]GFI40246.1 AB hydrolase superfamily protein YdjP [Thomasclavelia cocleata]
MKIVVNGSELFYEVTGQGRTMILVHGNGEDHHIFDQLVEVLKEYYTCYCIDSRGHGESSKVEKYSYQTMAEDIMDFIKKLGLTDVVYYGFSDGGIVGLLVASQSDLINDLIISGANIEPRGLKDYVYYLMKAAYIIKKDPKIKLMLDQPHINHYTLQKIKARTLVLAGSKDMIKESHTIEIAHNISGSKLLILPKEDHSSYVINSTKLAPIILSFVK